MKINNINSSWKFIRQDEEKAMDKAYNEVGWQDVS